MSLALAAVFAALAAAAPVDTACPAGMQFVEGKGCVAKIADTACPGGTHFEGGKCVANLDTSCPDGMTFVAGTGCVPKAPAAKPAASAGGYADEEILTLVKTLGDKLAVSSDKLSDVTRSLKKSLADRDFKKAAAERPVRGVLVFEGGEGGLVVKYMSAKGLASFKGGRQATKVDLRTWSAGAQLGGSATWGVALIMGLASESDLGGDYSGKNVGATAADESTGRALQMTHKDPGKKHLLWVVVSGRGLSASAGAAKLTVSPKW